MVSDFAVGTLLSLSAAILFGVHTSFSKTKSVIKSKVPMPIYNIYFLIGAAITCFIEFTIVWLTGAIIEFTYLGIICAFLLLCFEVFLLLSIQQIGVGYATGFSVFSASVVTPIVQIILGQPIATPGIMIVGLIMLAASVFTMSILKQIISFFKSIGRVEIAQQSDNQIKEQLSMVVSDGSCYGDELPTLPEETPLIRTENDIGGGNVDATMNEEMKISKCSMICGLVYSSLAGVFMSVLPLPSLYAPPLGAGLSFFLSFGVGCLIVIPLSAVIVIFTEPMSNEDKAAKGSNGCAAVIPYNLLYKLVSFHDDVWHFREVVVPAVSAGIVWSIGNICGFCSFMYLSYTVANAFVQCNVIVAIFMSVFWWKEVTDKKEIGILFLLSLVLVAGCAVILYGVMGSF